jgi:hypothetical protein
MSTYVTFLVSVCNDNCNIVSHSQTEQQYCTFICHCITRAICVVQGTDDGLIQSETCSQTLRKKVCHVLIADLSFFPFCWIFGFSPLESFIFSSSRSQVACSAGTSVSTYNIIRCKDSVDENLSPLPVFSCQYLWPSSTPIKDSVNIIGCMQVCLCFQVAERN